MPYVLAAHSLRILTNVVSSIMSPNAYDNTGQVYNVTRILNENKTFDLEAYNAYSPLYLPYVLMVFTLSPIHIETGDYGKLEQRLPCPTAYLSFRLQVCEVIVTIGAESNTFCF